jgi:hypothetical protein
LCDCCESIGVRSMSDDESDGGASSDTRANQKANHKQQQRKVAQRKRRAKEKDPKNNSPKRTKIDLSDVPQLCRGHWKKMFHQARKHYTFQIDHTDILEQVTDDNDLSKQVIFQAWCSAKYQKDYVYNGVSHLAHVRVERKLDGRRKRQNLKDVPAEEVVVSLQRAAPPGQG